ncbi:hypothetical protein DYY66_0705 [Candidatus Nitrosotalea sp. FS]|nr:hypothetical protein [Candidatus Nitrosotalea sp. FS]
MKEVSEFSIQSVKFFITKTGIMDIPEDTFKAVLVTTGRKTGKEHAVEIRAVFHQGKFYFSRRNPDSDWLKNSLKNPSVKVLYHGETILGTASLVDDQELCKKISQMKYSDKRSEEARIVLQVIPCV